MVYGVQWCGLMNINYHDSMQHAADLLCDVPDSRLLIENVPKVGPGWKARIGD